MPSGLQDRADKTQDIFDKTLSLRSLRPLFGSQTVTVIHTGLLKGSQFLSKRSPIDEEGYLIVEPEAPHIEVDRSARQLAAAR